MRCKGDADFDRIDSSMWDYALLLPASIRDTIIKCWSARKELRCSMNSVQEEWGHALDKLQAEWPIFSRRLQADLDYPSYTGYFALVDQWRKTDEKGESPRRKADEKGDI